MFMRFPTLRGVAAAALLASTLVQSASAACREDLVKADQDFAQSRSALQASANAAPAAKCGAYRRHVASLAQISKVFARCDTSTDKAKNAVQTKSALADFTRQMNETCKK
jgi:hypothetical protein